MLPSLFLLSVLISLRLSQRLSQPISRKHSLSSSTDRRMFKRNLRIASRRLSQRKVSIQQTNANQRKVALIQFIMSFGVLLTTGWNRLKELASPRMTLSHQRISRLGILNLRSLRLSRRLLMLKLSLRLRHTRSHSMMIRNLLRPSLRKSRKLQPSKLNSQRKLRLPKTESNYYHPSSKN